MNAPSSPIARFVNRRKSRWARLGQLLDRHGKTGSLTVEELDELVRLYRQITADLAVAQRDFPGDSVTGLLTQLVTRAHAAIYRHAPEPLARLRQFYFNELPREYRAAWRFHVASAALLFVPLILVALAVIITPDSASLLIPQSILSDIQHGHTWFDSTPSDRPFLASFIMTNNMEVALLALASGIFGAVGTVFVLVYNGIFIGGITGALIAYGLAGDLVGFVSPHGFLELSVVVVSGGCGLMLGCAVLWPGLSPRGRALVKAAKRAMTLLLGLLPALVVAGLLEGLVSPVHFAWPFKLAIGLTTAVLFYGYLLRAGRSIQRVSRALDSDA